MRRVLCLVLCLVLTAWSHAVRADTIAASLYEEGVALLKEKRFAEAAERLDASFQREPLSGTLMTLAQCHELLGRTATAWDEYQRAAGLAQSEGRAEYEAKAKELASALEPKLSRLRLELAAGAPPEGLEVKLAGAPVALATLGVALAVDPGEHEVQASAPGYQSWSTKVNVSQPGETTTVTIPALARAAAPPEPGPVPTLAPAPSPPVAPPMTPPAAGPDSGPDRGSSPTWPWVVGGAGVVMAGVAVGFLADDLGAISALRDHCVSDPSGGADDYLCDAGYDVDADNARKNRSGALALGFGIGAAVALTASIIGLATASDDVAQVPSTRGSAGLHLAPLGSVGGGDPRMDGLAVEGRF